MTPQKESVMRVFCAGATGFIGSHLLPELLQAGHEPVLLIHKKKPSETGVLQFVSGDVTAPETYLDVMKKCDAVINLTGIIREYPSKGVTFRKLHVEATGAMLQAAGEARIKRFIHMSALGARPYAPSSYHRTKYEAEELVRKSGMKWSIFRPSVVYGAGDAFITMLSAQIRKLPVIPVIGDGFYRLQPVHARDVARCLTAAAGNIEFSGKCFELCGEERYSYIELIDETAAAIGMNPPRKMHIPLPLAKLIISTMQAVPQFPVTMDQLTMLLEENICSCRWQSIFGFSPHKLRPSIAAYL